MPELEFKHSRSRKPGRTDVWAESEGNRVSELEVLDMPTRLAGTTIRTAGIANLFTHPDRRGQGFATALVKHTHGHLRVHGYALAGLFAIPRFYSQFGYATIGCDFALDVTTEDASRVRGKHKVRAAHPRDLPTVARIFNASNQDLSGSVVRDPTTWTGLRNGSELLGTKGLWVAVDGDDQPVGYLASAERPTQMIVSDGAFRDPDAAPGLVAHAADEARKSGLRTIRFQLHPEFALGSYVRRLDSRSEIIRTRDARYMVRILDRSALFAAIGPRLRLRASAFSCETPAQLEIRTPTETTTARLKPHGKRRAISLGDELLTQLLFGYWSAGEMATSEGVCIAKSDLGWLSALFPRGDSFCYGPDAY